MAYLDDNPPVRSQFRRPRRESPSGVVVVHTAENPPDVTGPDSGAENVANFIRNRTDPGSYHDLADSDSCINLVGYDAEAFHDATGSNPHSYGVSAATQASKWASMPKDWRDGTVRQMAAAAARYARWLKSRTGIVIPARRITREQSERRVPGFISHAERDPARRTDPGADFPWDQFLDQFGAFTGGGFLDMLSDAQQQKLYDRVMKLPDGSQIGLHLAAAMQAALARTGGPWPDQGKDGVAAAQARARAYEGALKALTEAGLYVPPEA